MKMRGIRRVRLRKATICLVVCSLLRFASMGQVQLVQDREPQYIFSGKPQSVTATFHNPAETTAQADLSIRLFQVSSATAALVESVPGKKLSVLPRQTVLDSTTVELPPVKAPTRFILQWVEAQRVIGRTELLVCQPRPVQELQPMLGEEPIGLLAPLLELKTLLEEARVRIFNLQEGGIEEFRGKLAIVGPLQPKAEAPGGLADEIKALLRKGVGVVWIEAPDLSARSLKPSFYSVPFDKVAAIIVQPELLARLSERPRAQLALVQLCRLALQPESPALPHLGSEP